MCAGKAYTELAAFIARYLGLLEAEFQQRYGLDLPALLWGPDRRGMRRLASLCEPLIERAPSEDDIPAVQRPGLPQEGPGPRRVVKLREFAALLGAGLETTGQERS